MELLVLDGLVLSFFSLLEKIKTNMYGVDTLTFLTTQERDPLSCFGREREMAHMFEL